MFTGIVSHTTKVMSADKKADGLSILFEKPTDWRDLKEGESISINGVCLTVEHVGDESFACHLVPETVQKTTFGIAVPKRVNLERSLRANDRFGGHFVQGHIDDTGKISEVSKKNGDVRIYINLDPKNKPLVVNKGSITLDGVSLTVAELKNDTFCVALIPFTLTHTTLGKLKVGDWLNLEFDMIGKHIVRGLKTYAGS